MRKDLMRTEQMLKKIKNPLMKVEGEEEKKVEGKEGEEVKESQWQSGTGQPKNPNVNTTGYGSDYDLESIPKASQAIVASIRAYQKRLEQENKD